MVCDVIALIAAVGSILELGIEIANVLLLLMPVCARKLD